MVNDVSFDGLLTVCTTVPITIWVIYLTALNGSFIFVSNVAYIIGRTWLIRLSILPRWFGWGRLEKLSSSIPSIFNIGTNSNGKHKEAKIYGIKYIKGNFDRLVCVKILTI